MNLLFSSVIILFISSTSDRICGNADFAHSSLQILVLQTHEMLSIDKGIAILQIKVWTYKLNHFLVTSLLIATERVGGPLHWWHFLHKIIALGNVMWGYYVASFMTNPCKKKNMCPPVHVMQGHHALSFYYLVKSKLLITHILVEFFAPLLIIQQIIIYFNFWTRYLQRWVPCAPCRLKLPRIFSML